MVGMPYACAQHSNDHFVHNIFVLKSNHKYSEKTGVCVCLGGRVEFSPLPHHHIPIKDLMFSSMAGAATSSLLSCPSSAISLE